MLPLLLLLSLPSLQALECRPCIPENCPDEPDPFSCSSGELVRDLCDCCLICAKAEGDICGGDWDLLGRCASSLTCTPTLTNKHQFASGVCEATNTGLEFGFGSGSGRVKRSEDNGYGSGSGRVKRSDDYGYGSGSARVRRSAGTGSGTGSGRVWRFE